MGTVVLRRNHGYGDGGLAIGRYIFITNKDKDKDEDKDKETEVHCRGRPKDKLEGRRKWIQRLRKEERKAKTSRGAHPAY